MLGMLRRTTWLQRDLRFNPRIVGGNPVAAYVLGLAFGFGWTPALARSWVPFSPCAAGTNAGGVALLGSYALGLGVPFLITALFLDRAVKTLRHPRRLGQVLQLVGWLVLVVFELAVVFGYVSTFSMWLLDMFPALGQIG